MSILSKFAGIENIGTRGALDKLVELFRESRSSAQQSAPLTTLFLKSGLSMRGQVLALSDDSGPFSVLFLIHDPKAPEPTDLTYVQVDEIAALTIHGAVNIVDHLSDGRITRSTGQIPSRGDLAGLLKTILDDVNKQTGSTMMGELREIPENAAPAVYHALHLTLRDLHAVLKKIASEELGSQALREKGFHFSFRIEAEPGVQIVKSKCAILIGQAGENIDRPSRESIRMNIEEFL